MTAPVYPFTNERTGRTEWLTAIAARNHPRANHLRRQSNRPRQPQPQH